MRSCNSNASILLIQAQNYRNFLHLQSFLRLFYVKFIL
jgi:hypothetical protein